MLPRCFILLGVLTLVIMVVSITAEEEEEEENDDRANPAVKIVAKIIGSLFTEAAASCLTEAATKCKDNWRNPSKAVSCAKNFWAQNKGRCATG